MTLDAGLAQWVDLLDTPVGTKIGYNKSTVKYNISYLRTTITF
jgi:hypothetical protein